MSDLPRVVCRRCKDTRIECSGRPGYCIPCAQDKADEEAFDGEHAMYEARSARWARESRERLREYDPFEEMPPRPVARVLGIDVDRYEDPPSLFPNAIAGEQ